MRPSRTYLVALAAVLAVQLCLMLTTLVPAPHNGGDNAGYVALAHSLLSQGTYTELWDPEGLPHTKYPPVFPLLLALWIAGGARSWVALKMVPALFTTLSVVLAFMWAARRRGPVAGATVGVLVAASTATLWSSHWILSDPPFVTLTLLSLWAMDRAAAEGPRWEESAPEPLRPWIWVLVGAVAAVLAYFTRSAGLPLLVALGAWLLLRRRWVQAVVFGALAGVPALLWWLRARGTAGAGYVSEFWLVDPYDPGLGRVGMGGLASRVGGNVVGYVGRHVPEGLVGAQGSWVAALGVALVVLALLGWARRLRERVGVAELFLPLYAGLILLWPTVWSGDRFALPVLPLLLLYAGEALHWSVSRLGTRPDTRPDSSTDSSVDRRRASRAGAAVVAAGALVLLGPALVTWRASVRTAVQCTSAVRRAGPFSCWGPTWQEFVGAARWSGASLPEGSAVLTRKPRIFFVLSGVPSRTYPFSEDPDAFLAAAGDAGARYVLLDYVGPQGPRYVGGVIQALPEAFCSVRSFGAGAAGGARTQLLGIVPPGSGLGGSVEVQPDGRASVTVPPCPPELSPVGDAPIPGAGSGVIPLLERRR
jgi:4-amino-4-deoxy-L-arabinose transferase-like glycosyltransferase